MRYNSKTENVSLTMFSDDLVDRNCTNCHRNCIDYQTWLKVQNCLHKVVRDPLFELFIMACIICNTIVLAIEHHGMSQNVRNVLDVGNKVNKLVYKKIINLPFVNLMEYAKSTFCLLGFSDNFFTVIISGAAKCKLL